MRYKLFNHKKTKIEVYDNTLNKLIDAWNNNQILSEESFFSVKELVSENITYTEYEKSILDILNPMKTSEDYFREMMIPIHNSGENYNFFNSEDEHQNEIQEITSGRYRNQLYQFTYNNYNAIFNEKTQPVPGFKVYPLMNKPGFRCTTAIETFPQGNTLELQINFLGTIDFASEYADIDKGGPGQELLKKYEKDLIIKISSMIDELSELHPDKKIRIKLAGHSLGGALAKGFTHTIQRACILQNKEPEQIIEDISRAGFSHGAPQRLLKKLISDKNHFKGLNGLAKLEGVTLYALGAPGVSNITDEDATALTHVIDDRFIRIYNHYHQKDIIRKFGESEFLSGKFGNPSLRVNKAISYSGDIDDETKRLAGDLPFPGITNTVMAAHNLSIHLRNHAEIKNIPEMMSSDSEQKFVFSAYRWALYRTLFFIAHIISKLITIQALATLPEEDIETPRFISI